MLTIYVLHQSQLSTVQLLSHVNLIYEFSTDAQKMSHGGYSVSSLEVCLESMLDEDPQFDNDDANLTRLSKVEEIVKCSSIDFSDNLTSIDIETFYEQKKDAI
jgi:hypothetical protein